MAKNNDKSPRPLVEGIIQVCGENDTGKTTFALECGAAPERMCFIDDDVKGLATAAQVREANHSFGAYYDLALLRSGKREIQFHEACLDLINGIQPGQFDALVWDTWRQFENTCHPWVVAHARDFRASYSPMGIIKASEMANEAEAYEASILDRMQTLVPTVVLVTHLRDQYVGQVKSGNQIPASGKALNRVCRLRIWLRHNPNSPVPIGLVMKRIDVKRVTEFGLRTVSILPRKITPREDDASLWDTIGWYFDNPVGLRPLEVHEIPDEYELALLNGTMTADQRRMFDDMMRRGLLETAPSSSEETVMGGGGEIAAGV